MLSPLGRLFVEPVPLWLIATLVAPFLVLELCRAYWRYAGGAIHVQWMEHSSKQVKAHSESIGVLAKMAEGLAAAAKPKSDDD